MKFPSVSSKRGRSLVAGLAAVAVLGGAAASAAAAAAPAKYRTHAEAAAQLKKAGVTWSSSGGCTNRERSDCTSFTRINKATVSGVIAFRKAGGCAVRVTGGSERGHAAGTYSHYNGYKADVALGRCVDTYITKHFKDVGERGDGARMYRSAAGNVYAREGNHWDITYYNSRV
ncbi:hypothetical protein ACFYQ5_19340 [Streptomyces sp. NPDC005794]|uniref:hypothetical protein n=1 Tax=Streptomyces sp. NPDC005794 TaxID=3364733 RepID=UPI0036A2688E